MKRKKQAAPSEGVPVTVLVSDQCVDDIAAVAKRCAQAGLRDVEVLEAAGVIAGKVDPSRRSKLKAVRGVSEVEDQEIFSVGPPDRDVQ